MLPRNLFTSYRHICSVSITAFKLARLRNVLNCIDTFENKPTKTNAINNKVSTAGGLSPQPLVLESSTLTTTPSTKYNNEYYRKLLPLIMSVLCVNIKLNC